MYGFAAMIVGVMVAITSMALSVTRHKAIITYRWPISHPLLLDGFVFVLFLLVAVVVAETEFVPMSFVFATMCGAVSLSVFAGMWQRRAARAVGTQRRERSGESC